VKFKRALFLASAIIAPLVFGWSCPRAVNHIRTTAFSVTSPFLSVQAAVHRFVRTQIDALVEWPRLRKKAAELQRELDHAKGDLATFSELRQENERLTRLLDLKGKISSSSVIVAARLIARDPSQWSQFVILNRGIKDGVRTDSVVVAPSGLVGRVVGAGAQFSKAILLTDQQCHVSGLDERTRDVGLVSGTGSRTLRMTYLDREAKVQVGDIIISSGFGGIYPKGIPIGRVETVGEEQDQLTLFAVIEPFVSFSKLEEVLCVSSQASV